MRFKNERNLDRALRNMLLDAARLPVPDSIVESIDRLKQEFETIEDSAPVSIPDAAPRTDWRRRMSMARGRVRNALARVRSGVAARVLKVAGG